MITLDFSKLDGLVPVIVQDHQSGTVLMLAFMNQEAWELTLHTGYMHYYSRSRNKLWRKGETSGNVQEVKELRVDCDNDTVLANVRQVGDAACHTGFQSCFYRVVDNGALVEDGVKVFDPKDKYGDT
ncbi:MAG TPA: phosphoribosyl-AMP cyclohydrolase [Spirochaetia bacterium]|nr:phosphoribosyl-AMP cyclohydrolase [Spirochaetia bacterium]